MPEQTKRFPKRPNRNAGYASRILKGGAGAKGDSSCKQWFSGFYVNLQDLQEVMPTCLEPRRQHPRMPPQANKKLSSKMAWFELLVGPATMHPASIQAFVTAVCDRSMPPSHLPPPYHSFQRSRCKGKGSSHYICSR